MQLDLKKIVIMGYTLSLLLLLGCGEESSEWSHPLFIKASKFKTAKQYKKAIYYYKRYLLQNPRSAETHRILASLYDDNLHEPLGAIIHYKGYLELADPKSENYPHYQEWLERAKKEYAKQLTGNDILVQIKKDTPETEKINRENEKKLIANEKLIKQLRKNIKYLYSYAKRVKEKNKKLVAWIKAIPDQKGSEQKKTLPTKVYKESETTSKFALRKKLVKTLFSNKKESKKNTHQRSFRYYTVKPGDSLGKISQKVYGSAKYHLEIYNANRNLIKSSKRLKIGQRLKIPNL